MSLDPDRKWRLKKAALAGVVTAGYLLLVSPCWYPLPDSALYLGLGNGLLTDHAYTFLGKPCGGAPPGYPLFLAAVMWVNHTFWFLNLVQALLSLLCMYLMYRLARGFLPERRAVLVGVTTAALYWTWQCSFGLVTEPLFGMLSMIMFLCLRRLLDDHPPWWALPLTLIFFAGASLVRIPGLFWMLPLLVMLAVHALRTRRWLGAAISAASVVLVGALILQAYLSGAIPGVPLPVPSSGPSLTPGAAAPPSAVPSRIPSAVAPRIPFVVGGETLLVWLAELFFAPTWAVVRYGNALWLLAGGGILAAIVLIGCVRLFRQGHLILALGLLGVLPALLRFDAVMNRVPRYFFAATPFFVAALFAGLEAISEWARARRKPAQAGESWGRRVVPAVAVLMLTVNGAIFVVYAVTRWRGEAYRRMDGGAVSELLGIGRAIRDCPIEAGASLGTNVGPTEEEMWAMRIGGLTSGHPVVARTFPGGRIDAEAVGKVFHGEAPFVIIRTERLRPALPAWRLKEPAEAEEGLYWTCYRYDPVRAQYVPFPCRPSRDWPLAVPVGPGGK